MNNNKNNKRAHAQNHPNFPDEQDCLENLNDPDLIVDRGYEFVELGLYEEAYRYFCLGIAIDDTDPDILNGLGITLCELGNLDKSQIVLERSIRIDPKNPITLANMAGVCWEMCDYEQALFYYHKSLEADPTIEEVHYNIINLYIEMGSLYMAFLECREFIKKFPDEGEAKDIMDDIILNMAISIY